MPTKYPLGSRNQPTIMLGITQKYGLSKLIYDSHAKEEIDLPIINMDE